MDRSEVITLLSSTHQQDDNGIWQEILEEKDIFCQVRSVTRNEFFEAGRNGLNPEYEFDVFAYDYADEKLVRYKDRTYSVYRTYRGRDDSLELYVERTGGDNGKQESQNG